MRGEALIVVKLGGSLAGGPHVAGWLDTLAVSAGRVVVVPGGGPFADAVRATQPRLGFDDVAAHHMALLAMEQYGRALASLHPAFVLTDSVSAILAACETGRVPVWAPLAMAARAPDIPATWDVTSDSLAAWLAGCLGARRLLLIKQAALSGAAQARDLAARGVVDPLFPRFLAASGAEAAVAAAADHAAARAVIHGGRLPGLRIAEVMAASLVAAP
jgi:dihydroneopterin aldolase